jgi:hypothetical protein
MFGLIRSEDIAPVDTDEVVMLAVQFPVEWMTCTEQELIDHIGNNAEKFLTAIYQSIKHHREHPEPTSAIVPAAGAVHQLRKVKDVGTL